MPARAWLTCRGMPERDKDDSASGRTGRKGDTMTVADRLGKLRKDRPGCDLAVFGDLSARLTLCADAAEKQPQEVMDAIMVRASDLLDSAVAMDIATVLGRSEAAGLSEAVVLGPGKTQLVLRSRNDASDVITCHCDGETELVALVKDAGRTLRQLGEG